jgi:pyridoxal biosynthesis lyase PdxS
MGLETATTPVQTRRMGLETATIPVQTRRMMQDPEPKRLQLSVIQIVAGTLATVSAAALGSTLGVEGTLLGTAIRRPGATIRFRS